MIDQAARAIYETRNGYGCKPWRLLPMAHKEPYLKDAEAAIFALREPSNAMGDAAQEAPNGIGGSPPHWKNIWQAMVDEAIRGPA